MSSAGPLVAVTVGVTSVDESLRMFRDVIGLQVELDVVARRAWARLGICRGASAS
jgi:hypothetical protein